MVHLLRFLPLLVLLVPFGAKAAEFQEVDIPTNAAYVTMSGDGNRILYRTYENGNFYLNTWPDGTQVSYDSVFNLGGVDFDGFKAGLSMHSNGHTRAYSVSDGNTQLLDSLGFDRDHWYWIGWRDWRNDQIRNVSGDGRFFVGRSHLNYDERAVRWDEEGNVQRLGELNSTYVDSKAYDVSFDGSVVTGISKRDINRWVGFRWTEEQGMVDLGDFPGSNSDRTSIYPQVVSSDGQVIVGYAYVIYGNTNFAIRRYFRWTQETGITELATESETLFRSEAISVSNYNDDGSVLVGTWNGPTVWDRVNGRRTVVEILGEALPEGFRPDDLYSVSDDGSKAVGKGRRADGSTTFFLISGITVDESAYEVLESDELRVEVRKDNGAIRQIYYRGEAMLAGLSGSSDFGVALRNDLSGAFWNRASGKTGLVPETAVSKSGDSIRATYRYRHAAADVLLTREYILDPQLNSLEVRMTAVNETGEADTFYLVEQFDPYIGDWSTRTDRAAESFGEVATFWSQGPINGIHPAFTLGSNEDVSSVAVSSVNADKYGDILVASQDADKDPEGQSANLFAYTIHPTVLQPETPETISSWLVFTDSATEALNSFRYASGRLELGSTTGDLALNVGESGTLGVEFETVFPATIRWARDGFLLSGQTDNELLLSDVSKQDAGTYTVTLETEKETLSIPLEVFVNDLPVIDNLPATLTMTEGTDEVLLPEFSDPDSDDSKLYTTAHLEASDDMWLNTEKIGNQLRITILNNYRDGGPPSGLLETATLTVTVNDGQAAVEKEVPIFVQAFNNLVTLEPVSPASKVDDQEKIVPLEVFDRETPVADLEVTVESLTPLILSDDDLLTQFVDGDWSIVLGANPGTYGEGRIRVTASDGVNSASREVDVTVTQRPFFVSVPSDRTVLAGSGVELTAVVDGYPEDYGVSLYRMEEGGDVLIGSGVSHVLENVSLSQESSYYYRVSSSFGSDFSVPFAINVLAPASIGEPLSDLTLDLGRNLRLEPVLTGTDVTGRWYFN